jgi:hypothetical protein
MKRVLIALATSLAAGISVLAQQPSPGAAPPVPLFSPDVIKSFTPADNPVTDAKAKLGDMIFDEKRLVGQLCGLQYLPLAPQRSHHPHRDLAGRR